MDVIRLYPPKICGHRGARGLVMEHTLASYRAAIAIGVDFVDMDVGMTRDGVVVVTHDRALNPDLTRDDRGQWIKRKKIWVHDLTFKQLQNYNVGRIKPNTVYQRLFPSQQGLDEANILSLQQVIQYIKHTSNSKVGFVIEIKTEPSQPDTTATPQKFALAIAKILEQENIVDRTEIQAFDFRCLLALQKINPQIATSYLTHRGSPKIMNSPDPAKAGLWTAGYLLKDYGSISKMIAALGGKIWGPQDTQVTRALVDEAHRLNLKIIPWGWAEKAGGDIDIAATEKLIELGVDGIITDRPDIVRGLMAARGMRIPVGIVQA